MSEFINNITHRQEELTSFSVGLIKGGKRKAYIKRYQNSIDNLTPYDVIAVVDNLIQKGFSVEIVKKNIGKILNVFYLHLKNYKKVKITKKGFLYYFEAENREFEKLLKQIKISLKAVNKGKKNIDTEKEVLKKYFVKILDFEKHYSKKENILFPYLEKEWGKYRCLSVMWAFHDEIRDSLKNNIEIFSRKKPNLKEINKETARILAISDSLSRISIFPTSPACHISEQLLKNFINFSSINP
jgi:hypothetical protein